MHSMAELGRDLFQRKAAPISTLSKLDAMNPADVDLIRALANNASLVERFRHQIELFARLQRQPEDTLRRFSLNGDNRLDFKEFQPALKRLFGHDISHAQSRDLFLAFCPTSAKKLDIDTFCQIMGHWSQQRSAAVVAPSPVPSINRSRGQMDSHANLRRGLELATINYDKLSDMFLKMDVGCTGYLTKEEFELAMGHLGIYFTLQEYDQLYAQLPLTVLDTRGLLYSGFLALLGVKMSSLFHNQKIWEAVLAITDAIKLQLAQWAKDGRDALSPDDLRSVLGACGITLSNADFTGLRLRLQPFTNSDGDITIASLHAALHDKTASVLHGASCAPAPGSPAKRGKKMASDGSSSGSALAAGKTTEQRNAEAQHSLVRMPDQKQKSEFGATFLQLPIIQTESRPPDNCLEARIRQKLAKLKETGPAHLESVRNVFPGDRFGRLTRGQLRQSLAQLGIVSRHADVEGLFWTLDPTGRGYVVVDDFYKHLQHDVNEEASAGEESYDVKANADERMYRFEEQRFIDALEVKVPNVLRVCRRIDSAHTGSLSKADFIWAMQEAGLLMSQSDASTAISTLSSRKDGVVAYETIAATLEALRAKRRRHATHLSNTALLLDPPATHEPQAASVYHDYPARRSSLSLSYDEIEPPVQEKDKDLTFALQPNPTMDPKLVEERQIRQAAVKQLGLINSILEKRSDLKLCFDLYPYKPSVGGCIVLSLDAIAEILTSARMGLDIPTLPDAVAFVRSIVPGGAKELSFVELIRGLNQAQHTGSPTGLSGEPIETWDASCVQSSIRRKLALESSLRDVGVHNWSRTGSIIVRHAFKGLASREMTTGAALGGQYDATCRNADLKHVCFRLSLDLTPSEAGFLLRHMHAVERGFFSSSDLFQCFSAVLFPPPHPTPAIA
ncbi:hypothetical protein SPRG_02398 [Saprolegnia parasitica CBS 223.65]|uniref:EF-hand domain-containing protein n=1 Tax=Saprolegnia parasitica (strain CBS 223.65) TaxID=695850 RepID=A0A067CQF3_SAPPC|nr:hypothetical protein SPRG_02398 [Saprolegnia parasitica CBS 223.65]KDO32698.1 hypothetical protein SPRG_02398 [Saprolegnia parasitica CBS 223.65]|eukprot:XP_012196364.1 hypothetical protein SPRG_02398 [Saprolegnia parasitica CBS 223.65]